MLTFTFIFLTALFISTAIDFWLNQRQLKSVLTHRNAVPDRFVDNISLEAHQKAADYTTTKMRVGTWAGFYSLGLLLAWTLGGGLDIWDQYLRNFAWSPLFTGVIFILGFADFHWTDTVQPFCKGFSEGLRHVLHNNRPGRPGRHGAEDRFNCFGSTG